MTSRPILISVHYRVT